MAREWDSGSDAEETTATALTALLPTWTVIDRPTWPGGRFATIDHVVVGPAGVFVIDTKAWTGRVMLEDGVLWQNGQDRSPAVWDAAAAAKSLCELVSSVRPDHVHAVVCLAEGDVPLGWVDDVMVCTPAQLVPQLTAYPEVLPGGLARAVSRDVDRRLHPEPSASVEQTGLGRRRPFGALVIGVLAIALAVVLLTQSDAVSSLLDRVVEWAGDLGT